MQFEFNSVGRVVLGRGQLARVGEIVAAFGGPVFVVYNGGTVDPLLGLLAAAKLAATPSRQRGEPTAADVDRAVAAARAADCATVIGFGGGSAIDAAKAVAGLLTNGGLALDYLEVVGLGKKITKPAAPWVAIPTTAGTGAEATRNAVVGVPQRKFKASLRSEHLLARVALIDPELGVGVPPAVTASSGMDALCQLIEAYTSSGAQPMTDALALHGITLAGGSLRRAFEDGHDLDAREAMAMAALLSGIALTNAGLGAVHGFAAPLGANFPVPHGTACAALLPHVIRANVAALRRVSGEHPALARYAEIARILTGDPAPESCVAYAAELAAELKIPPLSQFGVTPAVVPEMVALARRASSMRFNPVALGDEALADVLLRGIGSP